MTEIINVNDKQLQVFKQHTWDESEKIMIAVPCEYKKEKKKFTNGFLVCTYGTNYIFKSKILGLPQFDFVFHLLECNKFHVLQDKIVLTYDSCIIEIKTENVVDVAALILKMFSEMTWKCNDVEFMKIQTDVQLPNYKVTQRAPNSLMNRALFLSHFYDSKGEQLHTLEYFKKLEAGKITNLVLSKRFHPGNFAAPFGHAIAWEASLNTLSMQSFGCTKFSRFFDAMLQNSQTIEKVAFTDYKEDAPTFDIVKISSTKVRTFWFLRSTAQIIINFFLSAQNFPNSMKEILVSHCSFKASEFNDLVTKISRSQSACEVKKILIAKLVMKKFPFDDITRLISFTTFLETLTFREIDTDASEIIRAIAYSSTHLLHLAFTKMVFKTAIPAGTSPPASLLALNISYCGLTAPAFKSIFEYLCLKPKNTTMLLSAQGLSLKPEAYSTLSELNFGQIYPNISEFDWSGNAIPIESMRFFFAFLFTQKRCHLLMMNEVRPEDKDQFLAYLTKLVVSVPILGLDLCGKYPSKMFIPFLESLHEAQYLRRLKFKNKLAGDAGLAAYQDLIEHLPELVEVGAEGFKPKSVEKLIDFWIAVREHPKIKTCNLPTKDIKALGLPKIPAELVEIINDLKKRPRLSTTMQRLEYMTTIARKNMGIEETDSYTYTTTQDTEIFEKTLTVAWDDQEEEEELNDATFGTEEHEFLVHGAENEQ